jgi:hypothetical protein
MISVLILPMLNTRGVGGDYGLTIIGRLRMNVCLMGT